MREDHQTEENSRAEQQAQNQQRRPAFVHSHQSEKRRDREEEQHQHLREARERELPHHVGEQDDRAADEREFLVEKPLADHIPDRHRGQEKQDGRGGDHTVADIDEIGGRKFPLGFEKAQGDGIDERVQRRVEKIREVFRGDILAGVFQLPDREGADVFCAETFSISQISRDLSLIHRGGGGESAELDEEIKQRERDDERSEHRDANDRREFALIEGVDDFLSARFGVGHGVTFGVGVWRCSVP